MCVIPIDEVGMGFEIIECKIRDIFIQEEGQWECAEYKSQVKKWFEHVIINYINRIPR